MADYDENLSGFNLGGKGGSSSSTGKLDATMSEVEKRIAEIDAAEKKKVDAAAAAAASAKKEEEDAAIVDSAASEISANNTTTAEYDTEISGLKLSRFEKDENEYSGDGITKNPNFGKYVKTVEERGVIGEHIQSLQDDRDALEARNIEIAEDLKAKEAEGKFDWGGALDKGGKIGKLAVGGMIAYDWLNKEDPAATASAGETLGELGAVAAGTEYGVNQQIGNYGANFGPDALQDPEILAEWNAADRPDFNTWVQSVMADPSSPTARKLADILDPLNVESKERGRRIDEAANFNQKYDASQFQSPEMQAAQSYASGLTSDPLSMKNRGYMEQELAGNYSQGYYDDLRSDLFSGMHPGAVNTSLGMTKAALGAESAIRKRRDAGSERISRDDAMRMSFAPGYASVAALGSVDPLSLSNVGKMGIGNIEPMDPTGAFFSSFPAMEHDTNLAAQQRQPTNIQYATALEQTINNLLQNRK
jgi:hypothetical protein